MVIYDFLSLISIYFICKYEDTKIQKGKKINGHKRNFKLLKISLSCGTQVDANFILLNKVPGVNKNRKIKSDANFGIFGRSWSKLINSFSDIWGQIEYQVSKLPLMFTNRGVYYHSKKIAYEIERNLWDLFGIYDSYFCLRDFLIRLLPPWDSSSFKFPLKTSPIIINIIKFLYLGKNDPLTSK